MQRPAPGFTLVELMLALVLATLVGALAVPAWQGQMRKARRADATVALQQLQKAQQAQHDDHGLYAADLGQLGPHGKARSPEGLYRIELQTGPGDAYTATATAQGPQAADQACARIQLQVRQVFAERGPDRRCWNL